MSELVLINWTDRNMRFVSLDRICEELKGTSDAVSKDTIITVVSVFNAISASAETWRRELSTAKFRKMYSKTFRNMVGTNPRASS